METGGMQDGYIKLWRKSVNSAVFADPILWKLWCLCLMKATHERFWVTVDGIAKPLELKPGEFITGRFALHREFYPKKRSDQKSPDTIWRKLKILENLQNLHIRSHAKYSIISITNWNQYQESAQQVHNTCTTGAHKQEVNIYSRAHATTDFSKNGIPFKEIVDYLNKQSGKNFKHTTKATKTVIQARWNEGFRLDDFKSVVDVKCEDWLNNKDQVEYLRPQTLFGNKFDSYLNSKPKNKQRDVDPWAEL